MVRIPPNEVDVVPRKRAGVHLEGILDQVADLDRFDDAGHLGVALLHGHNVFDVVDVAGQLLKLADRIGLLRG
ncbi:MAG: hypothetical protein ACREP9_16595, partial [Candidatus Dormibacteraceae bacterium]